jgi:hypothetical protein
MSISPKEDELKKLPLILSFALILCFMVGCQDKETKPELEESKVKAEVEEGYFPGDGGYELDSLANGRTLIAFDQRSGGRSELVNDPKLLTSIC